MWVLGVLQRNIQGEKNITTLITFSSLLFVAKNRDYFVSNSAYNNNNNRQRND